MSEAPLLRTALHAEHVALGAKLVPFAGWEMPIQYPAGILAEHRATRAAAGVFDLSHMGELRFHGGDALAALDRLVSSDIAGLAVGRARYGLLANERGTIVDDVIVYRLAPDDLLMVVNASNVAKDRAHLASRLPATVPLADESLATALVAIQGPRAAGIVAGLAGDRSAATLAALPAFGVARARVAGSEVIAARTGYTGEDGFELFVAAAGAPPLWRALLAAGAPVGLVPVGLGARDTLRLEARLALYGNDIDETTTPLEAGLGWTCKLDKDFCGRDAIAREKERGPARRLVGLVVEGGIARHGHAVTDGGVEVGRVTSGTYGPTVGANIALAYVPTARAAIGTALAVRIRERDVPARVVRTPWYRRTV